MGGLVYVLGPCGSLQQLSCEAGSFSCHHNLHRFLQPEVLRLYFPSLKSWVVQCVSLPSCSSWFIHMQMWDCPVCQSLPCHMSSPPWLLISTPTASLNECYFFNCLVVRLAYSSIFWQFCFLFFFLYLLSFFWLCEEAKCIYLCLYLVRKSEVPTS